MVEDKSDLVDDELFRISKEELKVFK